MKLSSAVVLAVAVALAATPHVSARCCGKWANDQPLCTSKAQQGNAQACEWSDKRCAWSDGLCASEVEDITGGLGTLLWFIGACIFAFCAERSVRWARGMSRMWPSNSASANRGMLRHDIFACCGCSVLCCKACCCAPVLSDFNRAELDRRQWLWTDMFCGLSPSTAYHNRQAIRAKLNARPEPCTDCIAVACCYACTVAQNTLEVAEGFPTAGNTSRQDVELATAVVAGPV